jgi:hypothetical protein
MRHFKVTFEFTRIVESDDHDAVEDWATVVWHRIYPDFKAIYNKKGVQVPAVGVPVGIGSGAAPLAAGARLLE